MSIVVDSITINQNCTELTVALTGVEANFQLKIQNEVTQDAVTYDVTYTTIDHTAEFILSSDTFGTKFNGVMSATPVGSESNARFAVGSCEISCCMANLVQSGIDCHCQCDRCDEDIRTAEKVHLLIMSAEHAVNNTDNITDAVNKYNKAKEFCTATCACGC